MFGDFGHGVILLLAGISFLYYEKRIKEMRIKDEVQLNLKNYKIIYLDI